MDPQVELNALLATLPARGVKIVKKSSSWFWKALGWIVFVVTFGQNKTFATQYITTINKTIAVPDEWDSWDALDKLEIVTHELTHVDQAKRYTFVGMAFLYLFFPLPLGLAWFRYAMEREAYTNGFNVLVKYAPDARAMLIDHGVAELTSGQYGWPWPFKKSVRAWFEAHVAK